MSLRKSDRHKISPRKRHRVAAVTHGSQTLEARRLLSAVEVDHFFDVSRYLAAETATQVNIAPLATGPDRRLYGLVVSPLRLVRHDIAGNLDTSYGVNGFAPLFPGATSLPWGIHAEKALVRPDGKVLVVASIYENTSNQNLPTHFLLLQLDENGARDASFGNNGIVIGGAAGAQQNRFIDAELLSNGDVLVSANPDSGRILARYNVDGTPDTASVGGAMQTFADMRGLIAGAPDGGFYTLSSVRTNSVYTYTYRRYAVDGAPVATFGNVGAVTLPGVDDGWMQDLLVGPSNDLIALIGDSALTIQSVNATTGAANLNVGPNGLRTIVSGAGVSRVPSALVDDAGRLDVAYAVADGVHFASFRTDGTPIGPDPTPERYHYFAHESLTSFPPTSTHLFQLANGQIVGNAQGGMIAGLNLFDDPLVAYYPGERRLVVHGATEDGRIDVSRVGDEFAITTSRGTFHHDASDVDRITIADGDANALVIVGSTGGVPVEFDMNDGDDIVRLLPTADAASINILGGRGSDRVELSSIALAGRVTIDGGLTDFFGSDTGIDSVLITGTDGADTVELDRDTSLADSTPSEPGHPTLLGVERLNINSGAGEDIIDLVRIPKLMAIDVDAGGDADTVNYTGLKDQANLSPTDPSQPQPTLRGGDGDDVFVFAGGNRGIALDAGPGDDRLQFNSIAGDSLIISGGGAAVSYRKSTSVTLTIAPTASEHVRFDGPAGTGRSVTIDDTASATAHAYQIGASSVSRDGLSFSIDYSNVASVAIKPGAGDDTVASTAAFDALHVSVNTSAGSDRFILDRGNSTAPAAYTISGGSLAIGTGTASTIAVEEATVISGSGDDRFTVTPTQSLRWSFVGGAGNDELSIPVTNIANPQKIYDAPGDGRATFTARATIEFRSMEMVTLKYAAITNATFSADTESVQTTFETAPAAIAVHPDASVVELVNLTTGYTFTPAELFASSNIFGLNLSLSGGPANGGMPAPAGGYVRLPDGNYRLILHGAALRDAAGNPFAGDQTVEFYVLAGDANRDRTVDFADLVILAQQYGKPAPQIGGYARGDFSHDGKVDFADLVILAQGYNTRLPSLASTAIAPRPSRKSLPRGKPVGLIELA